jgi:hypothetical protein
MSRGVLFERRDSESDLLRADSTVRWVKAEG